MVIENTTHIDAAPDLVWRITVDVEHWSAWSPTVTTVRRMDEGPLRAGSIALIRQPALPECAWRVTEFEHGRAFTWTTRARGIAMEATHEVHPAGSGARSVLRLRLQGTPVTLFRPLVRAAVRMSLERENRALKAKCESY